MLFVSNPPHLEQKYIIKIPKTNFKQSLILLLKNLNIKKMFQINFVQVDIKHIEFYKIGFPSKKTVQAMRRPFNRLNSLAKISFKQELTGICQCVQRGLGFFLSMPGRRKNKISNNCSISYFQVFSHLFNY